MKINEEVLNECITESESYDILIDILTEIEKSDYCEEIALGVIKILRTANLIE